MEYHEFKDAICNNMKEIMGDKARVEIHTIMKNNALFLDGLTVMREGKNCSPTVYINDFYERFEKEGNMGSIMSELVNIFEENEKNLSVDVSFFQDAMQVRKRIVYKLVNYEANEQLLQKVPHVPFLDLAIVFYCMITSDTIGNATILIYNSHMEMWNMDVQECFALACKNTPRLLKPDLQNLRSLLDGTCFEGDETEKVHRENAAMQKEHARQIYILTNKLKINGAACILYTNVLKDFAERMETDFFILPSSIHEVLLLPTDGREEGEQYKAMVQEVNATAVATEEILSNRVYYYAREKDSIEIL